MRNIHYRVIRSNTYDNTFAFQENINHYVYDVEPEFVDVYYCNGRYISDMMNILHDRYVNSDRVAFTIPFILENSPVLTRDEVLHFYNEGPNLLNGQIGMIEF